MHITAPPAKMWTDSTASTAGAGRRVLALEGVKWGRFLLARRPAGIHHIEVPRTVRSGWLEGVMLDRDLLRATL